MGRPAATLLAMMTWPDGPVLCGIDFSSDSHHAWTMARTLAHQLDRPLLVVTAVDPLLAEAGRAKYGNQFADENAASDLARFLLEGDAVAQDFTTLVEIGAPAESLLRAAHEHHASLIVVGTRGLGRTKRLFFGSTALKILRSTDRAVLAVPHAADAHAARFDHIVCGIDFSEPSLNAARAAVELGRCLSAPVHLVHAVARIAVPQTWDALAVSAVDQRVAEATSRLKEVATTLGGATPSVSVQVGDVADVIAEATSEHPSTLIVLGLDGRDGHRPGTHAYRILIEAKAPVMAVPRPK